jgi:hypothetical protein
MLFLNQYGTTMFNENNISRDVITLIFGSHFRFINNILVFIHHVKIIGYSGERHGVIDHCDRRITLLSDTDI